LTAIEFFGCEQLSKQYLEWGFREEEGKERALDGENGGFI